jgi:hypothetical protein
MVCAWCRLEIHSLHDLGWFVRQGVHFGLFMGALAGQGNDEQRAEWLAKVSGREKPSKWDVISKCDLDGVLAACRLVAAPHLCLVPPPAVVG